MNGVMNTAPIPPQASGGPAGGRARGATALGELEARGGDGGHRHHRHLLGDAMRAISVFASAAFDVAVLGDYAEVRDEAAEDTEDAADDGKPRAERAHEPADHH
ncbi:hypothetical protein [Streptomyces sp. TRM 70361]|uniref:hypothetical protein n=1 Tax=Streptomyces sp. TRM 70361 TaxID=3116553 RepID=UPI003FCCC613